MPNSPICFSPRMLFGVSFFRHGETQLNPIRSILKDIGQRAAENIQELVFILNNVLEPAQA